MKNKMKKNLLICVGFAASCLVFKISHAADLGSIWQNTTTKDIKAYSMSNADIWKLHWQGAFNRCKILFPQTKSIYMTRAGVHPTISDYTIYSSWTCRNTP